MYGLVAQLIVFVRKFWVDWIPPRLFVEDVRRTGISERRAGDSAAAQRQVQTAWQRRSGPTAAGRSNSRYSRRGRSSWKKEARYHRRRLAETTMYRLKQTFGPHLKNRTLNNQRTESRVRCKILNRFVHIGLPKFERSWSTSSCPNPHGQEWGRNVGENRYSRKQKTLVL